MLNNNFDDYFYEIFGDTVLKSPLFHNSPIGLRFELGGNLSATEGRMEQVLLRAEAIFNKIFNENDEIIMVAFSEFFLENESIEKVKTDLVKTLKKYVSGLSEQNLIEELVPYKHEEEYGLENIGTLRLLCKCLKNKLSIKSLFNEIIHGEFAQVFFLNVKNSTIFYIYDDRGLDVVSNDKVNLEELYETCSDWILDYDRKAIDQIFKNSSVN